MSKPAVVINSNEEEIKRLTKKWKTVKNVGDGILAFGSAGFVGTVISPFDFEGPVAEILTAVLAVAGFITKKIGESHLEELEGIDASWSDKDREELNKIKNNIQQETKNRKERQAVKTKGA